MGKIGNWFSDIFAGEAASPPQTPSKPLDPISLISPAVNKIAEATTTVVGLVPISYNWLKDTENSQFLMTFFKNFLNYSFLEKVVVRLHLIVRAWSGILTNTKELVKFPGAFKTFQALAKFLSKKEKQTNGDNKEMINWLYVRFMVHPRNMIRVLYRGWRTAERQKQTTMSENELKCNGSPKRKRQSAKKWVSCFICSNGQNLTTEMTNFLKEGKNPQGSEEK